MDGTAVLNTNYTNAITGTNYSGGILTFPAGDTSEQINIPLLPRTPQGGTKSFTVMLVRQPRRCDGRLAFNGDGEHHRQ